MVQHMAEDHAIRNTSPGRGTIDNHGTEEGCCASPDREYMCEEENSYMLVGGARTSGELSGLKRTVSSGLDSRQHKRNCKQSFASHYDGINAEMIQQMDPNFKS